MCKTLCNSNASEDRIKIHLIALEKLRRIHINVSIFIYGLDLEPFDTIVKFFSKILKKSTTIFNQNGKSLLRYAKFHVSSFVRIILKQRSSTFLSSEPKNGSFSCN